MAKSKTNVIPINGATQEQEPEYEFSPLGLAVMDALDTVHFVDEIAKAVGEPECVVQAMLNHLAEDGMVDVTEPKQKAPRRSRSAR
jgi:hypothetical protein